MQNKKGLSDIVSTVLIILLVVAAIAIIGAIVLNVVNNAGTKITSSVDCQSLDVKANSCISNATVANGTFIRGSSGSELVVSEVTVYFQDANGVTLNTTKVSGNPSVANVTTVSYTPTTGKASKMFVAAKIQGNADSCPQSAAVTCA